MAQPREEARFYAINASETSLLHVDGVRKTAEARKIGVLRDSLRRRDLPVAGWLRFRSWAAARRPWQRDEPTRGNPAPSGRFRFFATPCRPRSSRRAHRAEPYKAAVSEQAKNFVVQPDRVFAVKQNDRFAGNVIEFNGSAPRKPVGLGHDDDKFLFVQRLALQELAINRGPKKTDVKFAPAQRLVLRATPSPTAALPLRIRCSERPERCSTPVSYRSPGNLPSNPALACARSVAASHTCGCTRGNAAHLSCVSGPLRFRE